MFKAKLITAITGVLVIFLIVGLVIVIFKTDLVKTNQENKNQISSSENQEENDSDDKKEEQNRFKNKNGYSFVAPKGWEVVNADDWNKKLNLEESKIVGIVKSPYKYTYPDNYHANVNIVVYRDGDDKMLSGEYFNIDTAVGLMAHKDVCLEGDEELSGNSESDRNDYYKDIVFNNLNGKEYFVSGGTNKGNWFVEDNIAIQVSKDKILTFAFHDLGRKEVVEKNLKVFKELIKGIEIN
ncbi:PsbP-related protein [Patescibacteria group bacterium]